MVGPSPVVKDKWAWRYLIPVVYEKCTHWTTFFSLDFQFFSKTHPPHLPEFLQESNGCLVEHRILQTLLMHSLDIHPQLFFFFNLAVPLAYRNSKAKDRTHATAVTTPGPQPSEPPGNSSSTVLKERSLRVEMWILCVQRTLWVSPFDAIRLFCSKRFLSIFSKREVFDNTDVKVIKMNNTELISLSFVKLANNKKWPHPCLQLCMFTAWLVWSSGLASALVLHTQPHVWICYYLFPII